MDILIQLGIGVVVVAVLFIGLARILQADQQCRKADKACIKAIKTGKR